MALLLHFHYNKRVHPSRALEQSVLLWKRIDSNTFWVAREAIRLISSRIAELAKFWFLVSLEITALQRT